MELENSNQHLINDLVSLVEESRKQLASTANAALTYTFWRIGERINVDLLDNERAEYGKQIVVTVSRHLTGTFGRGFEAANLRRMMQFAQIFAEEQIVVTLSRQLSWSHFVTLFPIKDELKRDFYVQMCTLEKWSVRTLRQKIDQMLFERTAISQKPEKVIKHDLEKLKNEGQLSPDLVFKSPYFLDFTGLKDTYSEKSLEAAILRELESFIMELGVGFSFIERQKRMVIDGEDFHLDLLFFHRKLKRLVAIELKLGKFKAAYKGQMELYLRWLEKNEMQEGEETPLGLILCAEGSDEQIELLQLHKSGIKVGEYLTELPDKALLKQKLHLAIEQNRARISQKGTD